MSERGLRRGVLAPDQWLDGLEVDVADTLDCSPTAARIKVSRGLAAMRHVLDPPASPHDVADGGTR